MTERVIRQLGGIQDKLERRAQKQRRKDERTRKTRVAAEKLLGTTPHVHRELVSKAGLAEVDVARDLDTGSIHVTVVTTPEKGSASAVKACLVLPGREGVKPTFRMDRGADGVAIYTQFDGKACKAVKRALILATKSP